MATTPAARQNEASNRELSGARLADAPQATPSAVTVGSALPSNRLVALDQFRGYTVVGMLLVNYFGGYAVCPQVLKHTHDYCSYADTIMPQFLFAVGFALRLTFGRRVQTQGASAAYARMVRRLLGLVLVSIVVYGASSHAANWAQLSGMSFWEIMQEPLKRSWFQTLMHIAVTSLWILPVVRSGFGVRLIWMILSASAHIWLSYLFNFQWVNTPPNGIDGGPLGFLTWTVPAIVGTMACDVVAPRGDQSRVSFGTIWKMAAAGVLLMTVGYGISCGTRLYDVPTDEVAALEGQKLATDPVWPNQDRIDAWLAKGSLSAWLAEPPFVKPPDDKYRKWNYWMMSQRGGTLSYPTFAAGFSLVVFVLFYIACDKLGLQWSFFRTFGTNALIAYILHSMVSSAVQPFFPKDSPAWYALSGLALFFLITWLFVRSLEKQSIYLRL